MAWTRVQSRAIDGGATSSHSYTLSYVGATAAGNLGVVWINYYYNLGTNNTSALTLTRSGETWTQRVAKQSTTDANSWLLCFVCESLTASSGALTLTLPTGTSNTIGWVGVAISEWSGQATPTSYDASVANSQAANTTAQTSTSLTASAASDLFFGAMGNSDGATPTVTDESGWTNDQAATFGSGADLPINTEYLAGAASATQTATWSTSAGVTPVSALVAFKQSGGGGTTAYPFPTQLRYMEWDF